MVSGVDVRLACPWASSWLPVEPLDGCRQLGSEETKLSAVARSPSVATFSLIWNPDQSQIKIK